MTNEEAQKLAPSYFRMKDDGADWRCNECKQLFKAHQVIKPFTPDGKVHLVQCFECTDKHWLDKAKDLGIK